MSSAKGPQAHSHSKYETWEWTWRRDHTISTTIMIHLFLLLSRETTVEEL